MNHRVMVGVLVEGRAVARMAQNTRFQPYSTYPYHFSLVWLRMARR